ncbi:MAG: VCBS repeat-containing protein [Myxococcota bacterium]
MTEVDGDPFDFGNDAPVVTAFATDASMISVLAVLRFTVTDSAGDPVSLASLAVTGPGGNEERVEIESGVGTPFPSGALSGFATSTDGTANSILWDSSTLTRLSLAGAVLRIEVQDEFGGVGEGFSAAVTLVNNLAPSVTELRVVKPSSGIAGPTPITFVLSDAESDPVDIQVEISYGGSLVPWAGVGLRGCPLEGRLGLSTSPAGERHRFVWDPSELELRAPSSATLRVRVTDGQPHVVQSEPALAVIPIPVDEQEVVGGGIPQGPLEYDFSCSDGDPVGFGFRPAIVIADFDRDGFADVLESHDPCSSPRNDSVTIHRNRGGTGRFPADDTVTFEMASFATLMGVGDFDGDNINDLVYSIYTGTSTIRFATGDGLFGWDGTFTESQGINVEALSGDNNVVVTDWAVADFDGDGLEDVAAVLDSTNGLELEIFGTLGAASLVANRDSLLVQAGSIPNDLRVLELHMIFANDDGIRDLALTLSDGRVLIFLGAGDGTFSDGTLFDVVADVARSSVTDYDEDGFDDLILTLQGENAFVLARSDGTGGYETEEVQLGGLEGLDGVNFTQVFAADFDGDGTKDLLANDFLFRGVPGSPLSFLEPFRYLAQFDRDRRSRRRRWAAGCGLCPQR